MSERETLTLITLSEVFHERLTQPYQIVCYDRGEERHGVGRYVVWNVVVSHIGQEAGRFWGFYSDDVDKVVAKYQERLGRALKYQLLNTQCEESFVERGIFHEGTSHYSALAQIAHDCGKIISGDHAPYFTYSNSEDDCHGTEVVFRAFRNIAQEAMDDAIDA